MTEPRRQGDGRTGEADARPVVAFDFDGTLTDRDSFTAFLRWRSGRLRWMAGGVRLLPSAFRYLLDRDRGRIKAAAVRIFLRGTPRGLLAEAAERFAAEQSHSLFRPDALATWERHGREGALRVIVTASPEETVAPFARRLNADRLIGSRLAFDREDRVAGGLDGPNCRGPEKVRRLRLAFGDDLRLTHAYGDTSGDREMLAFAEEAGFRVFTARPADCGHS